MRNTETPSEAECAGEQPVQRAGPAESWQFVRLTDGESDGTTLETREAMTSLRRRSVLIFGEGAVANVQVVAAFEQGEQCALGLSARDAVVVQREALRSLGKLLCKDGFDVSVAFDLHAATARVLGAEHLDAVVGDISTITPMLLSMMNQIDAVHPTAAVILVTERTEHLNQIGAELAKRVCIMAKPLDYESFLAEIMHLTSRDASHTPPGAATGVRSVEEPAGPTRHR